MRFEVSDCSDVNLVIQLFESQRDEPFISLANTKLMKIFSRLDFCKVFEAKVGYSAVGSVYAMRYLYGCGWLGGLIVHREFRRKGLGRALLEKALDWLDAQYAFAFVEPQNMAAQRLFEGTGFQIKYRRLYYTAQTSTNVRDGDESLGLEPRWRELEGAIGYRERCGIVNLGYYPVKLTKEVFDDLKKKGRVLRLGDVIAVVEKSYVVEIDGYTFIFNDRILNKEPLPIKKEVVEVNPFYIKHGAKGLMGLTKSLAREKEAIIWTYEDDPIANKLALKGTSGALVLEFSKK